MYVTVTNCGDSWTDFEMSFDWIGISLGIQILSMIFAIPYKESGYDLEYMAYYTSPSINSFVNLIHTLMGVGDDIRSHTHRQSYPVFQTGAKTLIKHTTNVFVMVMLLRSLSSPSFYSDS